jgi:hypothetical protein
VYKLIFRAVIFILQFFIPYVNRHRTGNYPHLLFHHILAEKFLDNGIFGGEKQAQTSEMLRTLQFSDLWVITSIAKMLA